LLAGRKRTPSWPPRARDMSVELLRGRQMLRRTDAGTLPGADISWQQDHLRRAEHDPRSGLTDLPADRPANDEYIRRGEPQDDPGRERLMAILSPVAHREKA